MGLSGKCNLSAETRFWLQVDKNGPIHPVHGQCWTWIGHQAASKKRWDRYRQEKAKRGQ